MRLYQGSNISDVYEQMMNDVMRGVRKNPRGKWTREQHPVVLELIDPSPNKFLYIPTRGLNYAFALAEVLWILAGRSDAEFISFYNKNMLKYLDDDSGSMDTKKMTTVHDFHGGYGKRIRRANYNEGVSINNLKGELRVPTSDPNHVRLWFQGYEIDQLQEVYNKIQADIHTRQAVVTLWDVKKDNLIAGRRDYPCNIALKFSVTEGQLDLSVIRRSNDIVWGLPYNIIQFTSILEYMAGWLGLPVGTYVEFIDSLHIYEEEYQKEFEFFAHTKDYVEFIDCKSGGVCSKASMDRFMDYFFKTELEWRSKIRPETHDAVLNLYTERWLGELKSITSSKYWQEVYLFLMTYHLYRAGHIQKVSDMVGTMSSLMKHLSLETFRDVTDQLLLRYSTYFDHSVKVKYGFASPNIHRRK